MRNRLRPLGRAWGASGLATGFAALTHSLAGGHTPHAMLLVLAWALGAVIALPFTTRRASLTRLAGLLLPAQLIYHLGFGGMSGMGTASGAAPGGAADAASAHAGHLGHVLTDASASAATLGDTMASDAAQHLGHAAHLTAQFGIDPAVGTAVGTVFGTTDATSQAGLGAAGLMLAAHLVSALLSVFAVRHAERALSAAWGWCRVHLISGARLPRIPTPRRRASRPRPGWALPRPHLLGLPLAALRHRGPPAALAHA